MKYNKNDSIKLKRLSASAVYTSSMNDIMLKLNDKVIISEYSDAILEICIASEDNLNVWPISKYIQRILSGIVISKFE